MRPAKLVYIAFGGAVVALLVGAGFVFAPFGASTQLAARATAAAALVSGFAVILTALALAATVRVESTDFKAEERVKEDVARLLASVRSIYLKAAWLTDQSDQTAAHHASLFDYERGVIQEFLTSTTAPAFYALEGRISVVSGSAPEEWRLFSYYLLDILRDEMPASYRLIAHRAVRVEELLMRLTRADIADMSADVADLVQAIASFGPNRSETPLAAAAHAVFGASDDAQSDDEQLRELRRQGVADPDLDALLAAMDGDLAALKKAHAAGANLQVTSNEVLSRYRDRLAPPSSRAEPREGVNDPDRLDDVVND